MKFDISPGRIAALAFPFLFSACSDNSESVVAPVKAERVAVVPNSAAWSDTAWDTFVAQVTLRASRTYSVGGAVHREPVPLTYVLERRRRGEDWETKIRIPHQSWMPSNSTGESPARIAAMTFGADGNAVAEDEAGVPVEVQQPNPGLSRTHSATPPGRFAKLVATNAAPRPVRRPPHTKGSAWIQSYVTDRAHAGLQRDAIRAKFGARRGAKGGMEWYENRVGSDTRRVFLDSDKGLVRSVEFERDGKRIRTTSYSYAEQPDGSMIRTGVHTEAIPTDGHSGGTVDVQFSDVHLEKRATP